MRLHLAYVYLFNEQDNTLVYEVVIIQWNVD